MLHRTLSVWLGYRSDYPGFCLGTSLLITLMLLMYTGGIQASLSVGPGGDFPRLIGNCASQWPCLYDILVLVKWKHLTPFLLLRCVPVRVQSRWAALSAGQCCSPAAGWTMPGTSLGYSRFPRPLRPDNDRITSSVHPCPLCRWGWSNQGLWLLCHPAGTVYSAVSSGDTEEASEVFASLVSPLAASAGWSAAAARDTCPASLLLNMHRAQLYPFLFIQSFDACANMFSNKHSIYCFLEAQLTFTKVNVLVCLFP